MGSRIVNFAEWPRSDQFHFFRTYAKPHYAVTSRIDVTHVMSLRRTVGLSPYRACLHAIGAGIHAVPELCMRFRGDVVTRYDRIDLSMTVPLENGNFRYAYLPFLEDFGAFDRQAAALINEVAKDGFLNANSGQRDDLAYLSCLPWIDYTSINNALPGPDDCIPRVSWGRIVEGPDGRQTMAMTIEVHHALVDGRQVGDYFATVQQSVNAI